MENQTRKWRKRWVSVDGGAPFEDDGPPRLTEKVRTPDGIGMVYWLTRDDGRAGVLHMGPEGHGFVKGYSWDELEVHDALVANPADGSVVASSPDPARANAGPAELCTDCGLRPRDPLAMEAGYGYCRICCCKGGNEWVYRYEVDASKLVAVLGKEAADRVMSECRWNGMSEGQ